VRHAEGSRQLRRVDSYEKRIRAAACGCEGKHVNYVKGANIGGFIKVVAAMQALGVG
jgi:hypothetical protein